MYLWIVRAIYILVLAGAAAAFTSEHSHAFSITQSWGGSMLLFIGIMGFGTLIVVFDVLTPDKRIGNVSTIYFGILVGLVLAYLLRLATEPTIRQWADANVVNSIHVLGTIFLCYISVSVLHQTQNDFRLVIPYVEFRREQRGSRPLVLDASVIIDGRIADIAETGLIDQTVVVPRFVLKSLQAISEATDRNRKARGKRGLDVLERLKACPQIQLEMYDDESNSGDIDSRLIRVAKRLGGKLITNDLNLAKLAKLQEVQAVNMNAVSTAAKPPVAWGQVIAVKLVKEGEEAGQGIGYLEDGTMVVAEMGRNFVGNEVNLFVTSVLQTNAGRMVFGRIDAKNPDPMAAGSRS